MQETLKKTSTPGTDELDAKTVTIFVQSKVFTLIGEWSWDLLSYSVFCSDVMLPGPEGFIGTRGIIHPDDVEQLRQLIYFREAIGEEDTFDLKFRIITTYGEVQTLTGKKIRLVADDEGFILENPGENILKKSETEATILRERNILSINKPIAHLSEKINKIGTWHFNLSTRETYYSDNYYQLFKLPPQSLNAQLHTFSEFLYIDDKDVVIDAIDNCCRQQVPLCIEYRIVNSSEEVRFLQLNTRISFNDRGENIVYGIARDITDQKKLELELEQTTAKLDVQNKLLEFTDSYAASGHWQVDLLTRKFTFSNNYYKIFGFKPVNSVTSLSTLVDFVHPDDRALFSEMHRKLIHEHAVPDFEFKVVRPDGKIRQIALKGKLVISPNADMLIIGTVLDVTQEKINQKRLKELKNEVEVKEMVYLRAEQMAGIAGWFIDEITGKVTWSANVFSLIGIKNHSADFTIQNLLRYIHPDDRNTFSVNTEKSLKDHEETEFEFRLLTRGDNKLFKAIFKNILEEGRRFIVCVIQDITEQTRMERKLFDRIQFTETLSDSVEDKIIVMDTNYSIMEWNKPCETGFGKKKADVLSRNFFDVFPEYKNMETLQFFRDALAGETNTVTHSSNAYLKGNFTSSYSPLKGSNGDIIGIMVLIRNISKEVELQQRLNQRLNFIENLVEASIDPLIVLDKHLNYLYWNRQSEKLFGLNKEYVVGKNILDILPPTTNTPSHVLFKKVLKGETIYIPAKDNDNGQFYEVYLVPIKDDKEVVTGILWMHHELTKEMQLVEQLKESQHLLQQTTSATPDALTIYDLELKEPVYLNDALSSWIGFSSDELKNMGYEALLNLVHADDRQKLLEHNEQMQSGEDGAVKTIEYRLLSKDNKVVWVCNRTKVFRRDKSGNVSHLLSVLQNITENKNGG